jgi:hypothetical protein
VLRRRQKLVVTSAAVLGSFLGAVTMTAPAMASTHPGTARPASGTGTNIDQKHVGSSLCDGNQWGYCLWYSPNETGAVWGSIKQMTVGTIIATYPDDGRAGQGKPVRNDAASMGDNSVNCNTTTWVGTNYTGDFNWLKPGWEGNLTGSLRNNEASISSNNCT